MPRARTGKRGNGEGSIFRLPDGRWRAQVDLGRAGGKRLRKVATRRSRREAANWLRQALMLRDAGTLRAGRASTLDEWYAIYLHEVAAERVRPSTWRNYEACYRRHVSPTLGPVRIDKLQARQLAMLYRQLHASGLAPRTVQLVHAALRRSLSVAVRWELISRNVAQLVEPPRAEYQEVQALTVAEARRFIEVASKHELWARWAIALYLGLRQGETLGVCWRDVDLDTGTVRIRQQLVRYRSGTGLALAPVKSARSRRTLPLPTPVLEALRAHRARQHQDRLAAGRAWTECGLVFTTCVGTPIDHRNDFRTFRRLLEQAGLRPVGLHTLRHTTASLLLAQGVHPRVVMELLGHAQISLTMNVYSHVMPTVLREATDSIERILGAAFAETGVTTRHEWDTTAMGIFDEGKKAEQDAERLAKEHPEQADRAIGEGERLADRETGDGFDKQVEDAGQRSEDMLGSQNQGQPSGEGNAQGG